jgi:hypothetical protein
MIEATRPDPTVRPYSRYPSDVLHGVSVFLAFYLEISEFYMRSI